MSIQTLLKPKMLVRLVFFIKSTWGTQVREEILGNTAAVAMSPKFFPSARIFPGYVTQTVIPKESKDLLVLSCPAVVFNLGLLDEDILKNSSKSPSRCQL